MAISTTSITAPIVWKNGYITSVSSNVGWNQQPSRLTLNVVDIPPQDFSNGTATPDILDAPSDGYQLPAVGSFQTFNLNEVFLAQGASGISSPFKFEGIVVSHENPKITDSANIKQTVLYDTREVINNIPVVIGNLNRDIRLPQSINAYAWYDIWWPKIGVLNVSNTTDFGMSWERIRDAINGRPIGSGDMLNAWVDDFAEYFPNFTADGFYFNIDVPGRVSERSHDYNSKITWGNKVGDTPTKDDHPKKEALPTRDYGHGSIVVPVAEKDCPILNYQQPYDNQFHIYIRNFGRASGKIIHMDTGYEIDMMTGAASGSINPIIFNFYGTRYKVNLDNIPVQHTDFRIKGEVVYLGDLIDRVATFGQFDWFVKETIDDGDIKEIKIETVDRRKALKFDEQAINDWIDTIRDSNGSLVKSYSQSRELRNDPTVVIVYGAKQEQLTQKNITGQWYGVAKRARRLNQSPLFATDLISIGLSNNQALRAGSMSNLRQNCAVDFGHINFPFIAESYNFDELAMRAALVDSEPFGSLFNYLTHIRHQLIIDLETGLGVPNPGAGILLNQQQQAFIWQYKAFATDNKAARDILGGITNYGDRAINILEAIGHTIEAHAREYWGRQFIVRLSDSMRANWDITGAAFQGFTYNEATTFFRDKDGQKVQGFVVFKKLNPFFIQTDLGERESIFVKNSDLVTDFTPGPGGSVLEHYIRYAEGVDYDLYVAATFEIVDNKFVVAKIGSPVRWINPEYNYGTQLTALGEYVCRSAFSSNTQRAFMGAYGIELEQQCLYPQYAYIPLVSKHDRYGPWASDGLEIDQNAVHGVDEDGLTLTRKVSIYKTKDDYNGKLDILSDDDLSPWNMGGTPTDPFLGMNNAAIAKVANASSNLTKPITAKIVIEGLPRHTIGEEIVNGTNRSGANISDISIGLSEQEIVTTYEVKNFVAKQRDYRSENFRMGSIMSIRTTDIRGNAPLRANDIINKIPAFMHAPIRRSDSIHNIIKKSDGKYRKANQDEPPMKKAGFNTENSTMIISATDEKVQLADNTTNHANIGYGNKAAYEVVATIGYKGSTNTIPGKPSNTTITDQLNSGLKTPVT